MIITNKKTGEDITKLYIELMQGKITNKQFEERTGLKNENKNNKHN